MTFKKMRKQSLILFCLCIIFSGYKKIPASNFNTIKKKPTVSFTFDDGNTSNILDFKFEDWNQMILSSLEKENLKAAFFVTGSNKLDEKGQYLLKAWNDQGHRIGNHTFSHPNFNSEKNTAILFQKELLQTDSIISNYSNHIKMFRFPYLKEGQNSLKVDSLRNILKANNYENGYVTIDASDWYVNSRLIRRIKEVGIENAEVEKYKAFYLDHMLERANYYENLSYQIKDRHINHTLLLHHNLTSALFLDALIKRFRDEGWEITNAETAFKDPVFKDIPESSYAGESLIWSLAKQSGNYEESLRYPAEDSRYEEPKMNKLGL